MANCLQAIAFSAGAAFDSRTRISARCFSAGELWPSAVAARVWPEAIRTVRAKQKAKCQVLRASGKNLTNWSVHGLFPLTPALSLREREDSRQSSGESGSIGEFEARTSRLPLPRGEGRGEGEGSVGT